MELSLHPGKDHIKWRIESLLLFNMALISRNLPSLKINWFGNHF